ncbi:MAG: ROK family protein [Myxococcota bacterium]
MDIGGTKTVVVLARASGEILAESRLDDWASGSWERDVATLEQHARVLMRGSGVDEDALHALGLSVPGPLDPVKGIVTDAPNLAGWSHVPLVEVFYRAFGVQVLLENDANAAALAEWRFGAGQGARNLIYLTLSTGLGAGLILDGRLYRGAGFQAGEVGHIPLVLDGRPCPCGLCGCLETYVGGHALARQMREAAAAGRAPRLLELADGDAQRVDARVWVEALREGDGYASELRNEFLARLAQGIAVLIATLNPDTIVLGTIVRENPDLFMDDLRERVYGLVWPSLRNVQLEPGKLGARLPAYAALCVAALEPPDLAPPDASRR